MQLTVLGKYSPFPAPGGAGPGYWIESGVRAGDGGLIAGDGGSTGVLLDCGPGVLARFQEVVGPLRTIRWVILSHLHFDHTSDFHVLRYAAVPDGRCKDLPQHVTVYAPREPEREFSLLDYKEAVDARAIEEGRQLQLGGLTVSFFAGKHALPCYAVRIEGPDGVVAYSGDSRPSDSQVKAASRADLFLCEASAIERDAAIAAAGHLTARQAGEVARQAGVKKLLLTHLWPSYDEGQLLEECREVFPDAEIACERSTYRVR
ncbi:MAG: MBL fold metallo-hydrolase [Bacillota bacterium]